MQYLSTSGQLFLKGFRNKINIVRTMASMMNGSRTSHSPTLMNTLILPVDAAELGQFRFENIEESFLEDWDIELKKGGSDASHLIEAAQKLRDSDIPVAFPTETVYGLGADATRSSAVRGIYKAKQRPVDNPLIVHICSLNQLRGLLEPLKEPRSSPPAMIEKNINHDPIPKIYYTLIQRFWPGPLTILLENPTDSILAPEVTAGLPTFGARMPASLLALALIKVAGTSLAAPSANASTKPSPTTAEHVRHDLNGRIELILDGGPCEVGVESTVVDGLSDPPLILRPGGISIEQLRSCEGWEKVEVGYEDTSVTEKAPRAPGMKYRHYSPKAKVILFKVSPEYDKLDRSVVLDYIKKGARSIGILRTRQWKANQLETLPANIASSRFMIGKHNIPTPCQMQATIEGTDQQIIPSRSQNLLRSLQPHSCPKAQRLYHPTIEIDQDLEAIEIWDIGLGGNTSEIARSLFSGLRELDQKSVDVIFVEGIADNDGDEAAAIMNRLRKAAEREIQN